MTTKFAVAVAAASKGKKAPKMTLTSGHGQIITVQYAPRDVTKSDIGNEWNKSERQGRQSAIRHSKKKNPQLSLSFFVGYKDQQQNVIARLNSFQRLANEKSHVMVSYSSLEAGMWVVTNCSIDVTDRNIRNEPTRAYIEMTLLHMGNENTKATVVQKPKRKPSSSKPKPRRVPTSTKAKPKATKKKKSASRTYRVRRGDTLWDIAIKYYGNGNKWRKIADANGIRDPRRLAVGKTLKIPG